MKQSRDDVGREIGLDKSVKAMFFEGVLLNTNSMQVDKFIFIKELKKIINIHACMKNGHPTLANVRINNISTSVVTSNFNVIKWSISERSELDTKIRRLFTMCRLHHIKVDVDRL